MGEISDDEMRSRMRHPSYSMNKETVEQRSKTLRAQGRCGSISEGCVYVCTLMSHDDERNHQQQELGGAKDGMVYAEWEW